MQTKKNFNKTVQLRQLPGAPIGPVAVDELMAFADQAIAASLNFVVEYQLKQLAAAFPKMIEVRLKLLELAGLTGSGLMVAPLLAELEKLKVNRADLLPVQAQLALHMGDAGAAIELLKKLLQFKPNSAKAYRMLAEAYEAMGEKDQAIAAYDAAIARNPRAAEAFYGRGLLLKRQLSDKQRKQLENALAAPADTEIKPFAMLRLAKAWSHYGEVAEEFKYLDQAKQKMAAAIEWSADGEWHKFTEIATFCSAQRLQEAQAIDNNDAAPVFIIGMPRSGTTLLETILAAHPNFLPTGERHIIYNACVQVGLAKGKNGAFWEWGGEDRLAVLLANLHRCIAQHDCVKLAAGRRWVDKSLENFKYVGLIKMIYPRAKFIHVKRHPMAVCLSNYQHYIVTGKNTPISLQHLAQSYQIFNRSVEHWAELFPDAILSLDYESLTNDFESELRKILAFLAVDWDAICLKFYEQKSTVLTPSTMQVRAPMNRDAEKRWVQYEQYLQPVVDTLKL